MTDAQTRRIIAEFIPQAWQHDVAINVDAEGEAEFDITAAVLAMGRDKALAIRDDQNETDDLRQYAPTWVREWSGPFYVRAQDAIAEYYENEPPKPALRWTAGEWKIDRAHIYYTDADGDDWTIATIEPGRDGEADQRLMSAAPEMAAALQLFLSIYPDKVKAHPDVKAAVHAAESALRKAGAL